MGTACAQALAVLHPSEVRRLVLCAPHPDNGDVVHRKPETMSGLATSSKSRLFDEFFLTWAVQRRSASALVNFGHRKLDLASSAGLNSTIKS